MGRKALFPGKDHLDQIRKIFGVLGRPSSAELGWLPQRGAARSFVQKLPDSPRLSWAEKYPNSSSEAHEMLTCLLTFQPHQRIDAHDALRLPFLAHLHIEADEPLASVRVDWSFDNFPLSKGELQERILAECQKFPSSNSRRCTLPPILK